MHHNSAHHPTPPHAHYTRGGGSHPTHMHMLYTCTCYTHGEGSHPTHTLHTRWGCHPDMYVHVTYMVGGVAPLTHVHVTVYICTCYIYSGGITLAHTYVHITCTRGVTPLHTYVHVTQTVRRVLSGIRDKGEQPYPVFFQKVNR